MKICRIEDCGRKQAAKGLCDTHYRRLKYGFPLHLPVGWKFSRSVKDRLLNLCVPDPVSGCWLWLGFVDGGGYAILNDTERVANKAHRASYREFIGPIPPGAKVLHRCDVPACVNPAHLFIGTQAENMADMVEKNRQAKGDRIRNKWLNEDQVREIRARKAAGETYAKLTSRFGVTGSTIWAVVTRRAWKHV